MEKAGGRRPPRRPRPRWKVNIKTYLIIPLSDKIQNTYFRIKFCSKCVLLKDEYIFALYFNFGLIFIY